LRRPSPSSRASAGASRSDVADGRKRSGVPRRPNTTGQCGLHTDPRQDIRSLIRGVPRREFVLIRMEPIGAGGRACTSRGCTRSRTARLIIWPRPP
jgi:hypothetical protein